MLQIQKITADAFQQQTLVLLDGTAFTMTMRYVPSQLGWFFTSLTYPSKGFTLTGLRITVTPNMLFQFQNLIPFGLACFTTSGEEPTQQQDFESGAASLYILTQAECQAYAAYIRGGALPA